MNAKGEFTTEAQRGEAATKGSSSCSSSNEPERFRNRTELSTLEPIQSGKEMLVRILAMLTKLAVLFDPDQYRVRESASALATPFEDEDDDEHEDESKISRKNKKPNHCSTEDTKGTGATDFDRRRVMVSAP